MLCILYDKTRQKKGIYSFPSLSSGTVLCLTVYVYLLLLPTSVDVSHCRSALILLLLLLLRDWHVRAEYIVFRIHARVIIHRRLLLLRTEPSPPRSAKPINRRILHARRPVIISCKHHVGRCHGKARARAWTLEPGVWACPQQILEWWCDSSPPRFLLQLAIYSLNASLVSLNAPYSIINIPDVGIQLNLQNVPDIRPILS